jgi:hypothetical protein
MFKIMIRHGLTKCIKPSRPSAWKKSLIALLFASFTALASATPGRCDPADRISGPFVHDNLVVYLIHGSASDRPVPMTLQEAVKDKLVRVIETGDVNQLTVENVADKEVFIQAGDIVKGGRQDRALTASLILPPHSGLVSLSALCVESGRWSGRPAEDSRTFNAADATVPSRAAKVLMTSPVSPAAPPAAQSTYATASAGVRGKQQEMWAEAQRVKERLSQNLSVEVAAPQSPSSLRLALDNKTLQEAEKGFTDDLQKLGDQENDVVGYVVAINGHLNSAAVYESNGLFRKMWPKQLQASAVEAIAAGKPDDNAVPSTKDVEMFLASADAGKVSVQELTSYVKQETRDADKALFAETQRTEGSWVARNYLAKTQ